MNILLTADLHLTDNPRDAYRWDLFDWIVKRVRKHNIEMIVLLGDLTDAKDRHSEGLVNRLMENLEKLGRACPTIFNPGNHDGIAEGRPFFRFSNHVHNVTCLTEPMILDDKLFLPHSRNPTETWKDRDFSRFRYIFAHQTFDGCLTENGTKLQGVSPGIFERTKAKVFSGDIHVPQKIGVNIEYVGAPYRIRFGDNFTPRVLMIGRSPQGQHRQQDLHFPTTVKFLIEVDGDDPVRLFGRELKRLEVCEGDQVKLRVRLPRTEYPSWVSLRQALIEKALKARIELFGPELHACTAVSSETGFRNLKLASGVASPVRSLLSYAKKERLSPALLEAGRGFLAGVGLGEP